jgi:hypothetical protein
MFITNLDACPLYTVEPLAADLGVRAVLVGGHIDSLAVLPGHQHLIFFVKDICVASVDELLLHVFL